MLEPISITPDAFYDDGTLHLALGLTPSALAKARRTGELRFARRGKRVFYLGRWIIEWLDRSSDAGQRPQGVDL